MPYPMTRLQRLTMNSLQITIMTPTSEWSYPSSRGGNWSLSFFASPNTYTMLMVFLLERSVTNLSWIRVCKRLNTRTARNIPCPPTWLQKNVRAVRWRGKQPRADELDNWPSVWWGGSEESECLCDYFLWHETQEGTLHISWPRHCDRTDTDRLQIQRRQAGAARNIYWGSSHKDDCRWGRRLVHVSG